MNFEYIKIVRQTLEPNTVLLRMILIQIHIRVSNVVDSM
mgnify:CR=1 FL=1|jgi:hypothetical protein